MYVLPTVCIRLIEYLYLLYGVLLAKLIEPSENLVEDIDDLLPTTADDLVEI